MGLRPCLLSPSSPSQAPGWGGGLRAGRHQRDVMLATRPYSAQTPVGLRQRTEQTWVDDALLPLGVGNDLVLVHHLDVLVLHVAAAEGRWETSGPAVCPVLGRAAGAAGGSPT